MEKMLLNIFLGVFVILLFIEIASADDEEIKLWIKDPMSRTVVDGISMTDCFTESETDGDDKTPTVTSMTTCFYNYYLCKVEGWYTGWAKYVPTGTESEKIKLWYCDLWSGSIQLVLSPSTVGASESVTPYAYGLTDCDGEKVDFKKQSCAGIRVSSCTVSDSECKGKSFTAPSSQGTYTYYACIDKDKDEKYLSEGEQSSADLIVTTKSNVPNPTLQCGSYPVIITDPPGISKEAGKSQMFNVIVINSDSESCSKSTFRLDVKCPNGWTCKLEDVSLTVLPSNWNITNIAIKPSNDAFGVHLINISAMNLNDKKYNATGNVTFLIKEEGLGEEKSIRISSKTCKDISCKSPSKSFVEGEKIYIKIETNPNASVKGVVYQENKEIGYVDLTKLVGSNKLGNYTINLTAPEKVGNYTIKFTASKEGYKEAVNKLTVAVENKKEVKETGNLLTIIVVIVILLIFGAIAVVFYIYMRNRAKKKETFDELYGKYKRKRIYRRLRR